MESKRDVSSNSPRTTPSPNLNSNPSGETDPRSTSKHQKISLWTILLKAATFEGRERTDSSDADHTVFQQAAQKRVQLGVRGLCTVLSKSLAVLLHAESSEQSFESRRKNLFKKGLFASRLVHSIFCSRLPSFQATLLPQMQAAGSVADLFRYLEVVTAALTAVRRSPQMVDSLVSCWQVLVLYLATYLLLEPSDLTLDGKKASSLGPDKMRLVDMSEEDKLAAANQAGGKLYHVTQLDCESFFSLPVAASPRPDGSGGDSVRPPNSVSISVSSEDYDAQYVLCSNYPPAIQATRRILSAAIHVRE